MCKRHKTRGQPATLQVKFAIHLSAKNSAKPWSARSAADKPIADWTRSVAGRPFTRQCCSPCLSLASRATLSRNLFLPHALHAWYCVLWVVCGLPGLSWDVDLMPHRRSLVSAAQQEAKP